MISSKFKDVVNKKLGQINRRFRNLKMGKLDDDELNAAEIINFKFYDEYSNDLAKIDAVIN